ncbi:type VI secretion system tip protein TssI/VgrG [Rhodovarius sp.]|uniref:type VI secretion system Vgr family protein n=1 Tax=Rhodovarius sp. TaxID=2972673 RepID=UPI00333F9990
MTAALQFTIDGLAPDALRAYAVDGTEALSSLYSFDIDCLGPSGRAMDPLALVGQRATLRITVEGAQPRSVHGIIDTVEIEPPSIFGDARYRFRLVPWLARLRLSRSNQIHGTANAVSVADVIEAELSGALRPTAQVSDTDLRRFEHELRLRNRSAYPKRDHVSQYEETDFAFISRLAEHAGIFYFFENNGDRESVVFADDNLFATPLEGGTGLQWKPWSSGGREAAPDTIQALRQRCTPVPQKVWLQDHNYRLPHIPLLVEAEVDSRGRGNWVEYGAHHRTPDEGAALARIRAEELRCHQSRWHGNSTVARLAPGRVIRLGGHPYTSWNQDYLVVRVRHEVWVPMPGVPESDWVGYRNSFEMIDRDVPFRPARVTPVPRMDGLLNGRIDGAGDGSKAEIDDQGRYRVKVPFDLGGSPDGKASQWIRMSSPFGGDGDGMHFPLFPNTEVVIACVNGDPDRPVILGAVPNPRNKAVVTSDNSLQNRLVTRSGMGFEMSNDGGSATSTGGGNGGSGLNAYGAAPPPAPPGGLLVPNALGGQAQPVVVTDAGDVPALASPDALASSVDTGAGNNYARMYVQDNSSSPITHTLRLGGVPAATGSTTKEPDELKTPGSLGYVASTGSSAVPAARSDTLFNEKSGIYDYTAGQHYSRVKGDMGLKVDNHLILVAGADGSGDLDISSGGATRVYAKAGPIHLFSGSTVNIDAVGDVIIKTKGSITTSVDGVIKDTIFDKEERTIYGNSRVHVWGLRTDYFMGMKSTFNLAALNTVTLGATSNTSLAASFSVFFGGRVDLTFAARFSLVFGVNKSVTMGGSLSSTTGGAISTVEGGRNTTITGLEVKTVKGIDAKIVTFEMAKSGGKLTSADYDAAKKELSAEAKKLSAANLMTDAEVVEAIKLIT